MVVVLVCGNVVWWVSPVGFCDYGRPPGIIKSYYFRSEPFHSLLLASVDSMLFHSPPPMLDNSFAIICQNNAGHGSRYSLSLGPVQLIIYTHLTQVQSFIVRHRSPLTELSHRLQGEIADRVVVRWLGHFINP